MKYPETPLIEVRQFGKTSLILGLIGLFIAAPILGTLAIIFGSKGLNRNQKYSIAGLVLGIIDVGAFPVAVILSMF